MDTNTEIFKWDDTKVPDDFFNDAPQDVKTDAQSVIEKVIEDEQDLTPDIFNDEDELSEEPAPTDKEEVNSDVISAVNLLKEKGLIDFELEENQELDEDTASELLEDKFEEAIESRVEELFTDLPDIVKQIVKYAKDGGNLDNLFENLAKTKQVPINKNLDLSDEKNQEFVIRNVMKQEGNSEEEINSLIEYYKDTGKLESISQVKFEKFLERQQKQEKRILTEQSQRKREEEQRIKEEKLRLTQELKTTEEIKGFKLDLKDKKELPSYLLDKRIKLENGGVISEFHKDIYEAMANQTTALQLAKLLRNRNQDGTFNFSNIETIAKTKLAKEVKDNLRRNKSSNFIKSTGSTAQVKSLADYF